MQQSTTVMQAFDTEHSKQTPLDVTQSDVVAHEKDTSNIFRNKIKRRIFIFMIILKTGMLLHI
jgi:hypothetical protein